MTDNRDETGHHYFAASHCDWRCSTDINELVATMDAIGKSLGSLGEYKLYSVPLPITASYKIDSFKNAEGVNERSPVVENARHIPIERIV